MMTADSWRLVLLVAGLCLATVDARAEDQPRAGPSTVDASAEQAPIEHRLAEIQAERARHSLGGPIALMAAGFGSAVLLDVGALVYWGIASVDQKDEGVVDPESHKRRARMMAAFSLVGLAVGISGAWWLSRSLRARRALAPERRDLLERRRALSPTAEFEAGRGSGLVRLGVRF